jgi:3-oxo-5-alpha-steroid 4-dehydrogenase 3
MREALTPLSEAERDQRDGDSLLALALLAVHVATRLAETYYVHAFSNSRQSVLVTAMGLSYYAALFLTLALDSTLLLREAPPPGPLLAPAHHKVGLVLFGFGYYVQRRAHAALAALRKGTVEGAPARYEIPRAPVFQFVSCPHYSAEIVLYAGILVIRRGALSQW